MEMLKNTAAALCVMAAVTGIVSFLLPKRGLHFAMEFALRLAILGSICLSVGSTDTESLFSLPKEEQYTVSSTELSAFVNDQLAEEFSRSIKEEADKLLQNYGVFSAETAVAVHISEEGVISISSIIITTHEEVPRGALTALEKAFGVLPEVAV